MFFYVYAISAYRRFTDAWFKISQRGSTVRQEVVAGLTTFLAMVYSVIVVPGMLGKAGFPPAVVFSCNPSGCRRWSIVMGLWAGPLAIGCAISPHGLPHSAWCWGNILAYLSRWVPVPAMGVVTVISATVSVAGFCATCHHGVAHGTGIGIGLFLLLRLSLTVSVW
ncbi:solute carrier family 23 protein [Escherichia coli]|uniref:solute carrier family 23 protein n=1 Tax=Escherichia coli TaxID=562 RepID=UPI001CC9F795|nr:solute carrier family 23 protein [Escherichia coli]UBO42275.1 hypothetical protein LCE24_22340 [Escherichia coli]